MNEVKSIYCILLNMKYFHFCHGSVLFCFFGSVSCDRYSGASVPQDVFLTHCSTIKIALYMEAMDGRTCPKTKEQMEKALKDLDIVDPWGRPYHIHFLGGDKYGIRTSGKDCISFTKDDRALEIQLWNGNGPEWAK